MIGRISSRQSFATLASAGRSSRTRTLWCRYLDDPSTQPLRVGFSVGRSYGRAVDRNLMRRRLRVIVGALADEGLIAHGLLLIGARPSAKAHTFADLSTEVRRLLTPLSRTGQR